jgi:hypothetical protein
MRRMPRLPDFSVVVWLRKTDEFTVHKAEVFGAAATEPYESTEYQGMVDFHWGAANLPEAKRLADALKGAVRHPELVLLHIMSRVRWRGLDLNQRRATHAALTASASSPYRPNKSRCCRAWSANVSRVGSPGTARNVGCWGKTGKHLLVLSFTGFDPHRS